MNNEKILIISILFILISGCAIKQESLSEEIPQQESQSELWQSAGIAIQGTYADAEIVEIDDNYYRMYYSIEPEVPGNKLEIFSSTSIDGINWKKEEGVRKEFATFPDIIKLSDKSFRMYF